MESGVLAVGNLHSAVEVEGLAVEVDLKTVEYGVFAVEIDGSAVEYCVFAVKIDGSAAVGRVRGGNEYSNF